MSKKHENRRQIELEHNIEAKLRQAVDISLSLRYGEAPDPLVSERVNTEWAAIERSSLFSEISILHDIATYLQNAKYPCYMDGLAGSSFILYLLGITSSNPLPPHTYCPKCKGIHWVSSFADGFDIPAGSACENDGTSLLSDGHNIPWQTIWGYGDFTASLEISMPVSLKSIFNELVPNFVRQELIQETEISMKDDHIKIRNLTLRFDLDLDSNEVFYQPLTSGKVLTYALKHWKSLADYRPEDSEMPTPVSFADVVSVAGIFHSEGAWDDVSQYMVEEAGRPLSDMISFRDDVFYYLLAHGFTEKDAWRGMNRVRKGQGLPTITDEMMEAKDKWKMARCERIEYLPAKSQILETLLFKIRSDRQST